MVLQHIICVLFNLIQGLRGCSLSRSVSRDTIATIVKEYDQQVLLPLLVVVSKHLNLGNVKNLPPLIAISDDSLNGEL